MKKILLFLLGIFIILGIILCLAKNFITREILIRKLTTANHAPVSIGEVDLSLRKGYVTLKDIKINSNINKDEIFIKMDGLKSFYKVDSLNKKIVFEDTEIDGFRLFNDNLENTETSKNGLLNKNMFKDNEDIDSLEQKVKELKDKQKKDEITLELKDKYLGNIGLSKENIDLKLKEKYSKFKDLEEDLKKLNSLAVDELKESVNRIKTSNKSDVISTIFSELKNIEKSSKKILKEADTIRLREKVSDFVKDAEFKETLDIIIKEFLDNNNFVVTDLDSYINLYLNSVYEEKIYSIFLRYNKIIAELDKRKEEDKKIKDGEIWELYFNNIAINSNMYGVNFYGEIKGISSRISKNIENIPFKLFGEKGDTIGEIRGYIDLDSDLLISDTQIPEINLKDINKEIFEFGNGKLSQKLLIDPKRFSIIGNLDLKNMKLNSKEVLKNINIEEDFMKDLVITILPELKSGNIQYEYNLNTRHLLIKSNFSKVFEKIINDDDLNFKKNLKEKIKKEYLDTILD